MKPSPERPPPPLAWTRRQRLAIGLFLLAVVVQVTVPSIVLTSDPTPDPDAYLYRYGWQMFTSSEVDVDYLTVRRDGSRRPVEPVTQIGALWGHVHYGRSTPRRLCAADARAVAVVRYVVSRDGERREGSRFSCA